MNIFVCDDEDELKMKKLLESLLLPLKPDYMILQVSSVIKQCFFYLLAYLKKKKNKDTWTSRDFIFQQEACDCYHPLDSSFLFLKIRHSNSCQFFLSCFYFVHWILILVSYFVSRGFQKLIFRFLWDCLLCKIDPRRALAIDFQVFNLSCVETSQTLYYVFQMVSFAICLDVCNGTCSVHEKIACVCDQVLKESMQRKHTFFQGFVLER